MQFKFGHHEKEIKKERLSHEKKESKAHERSESKEEEKEEHKGMGGGGAYAGKKCPVCGKMNCKEHGMGGGMEKTMHEFKAGELHSGSKKGPVVKNRKQAIAIGMNS